MEDQNNELLIDNLDDASIFWENQDKSVQDYEIPEPEEIPDFIQNEADVDDHVHVSDKDVKTELNMIRLNEPTAEIIVALMDVLIPLLLAIFLKDTDKKDIKLDENEKETLTVAWAQYLKTSSFNMSPGGILLTSILTIYGAKVTVAMVNKKQKDSENELLWAEIQLLKNKQNTVDKKNVS